MPAWPPVAQMLTATLVRNNARWPAYVTGNSWQRQLVDSLFEGDRLTLPRCATGSLSLRVIDGFVRSAHVVPQGEGRSSWTSTPPAPTAPITECTTSWPTSAAGWAGSAAPVNTPGHRTPSDWG